MKATNIAVNTIVIENSISPEKPMAIPEKIGNKRWAIFSHKGFWGKTQTKILTK